MEGVAAGRPIVLKCTKRRHNSSAAEGSVLFHPCRPSVSPMQAIWQEVFNVEDTIHPAAGSDFHHEQCRQPCVSTLCAPLFLALMCCRWCYDWRASCVPPPVYAALILGADVAISVC